MAHFYGWTHEYIMSLSYPVFCIYAEQIQGIQRDEYLMQLAIATNPHIIKAEEQQKLWRQLRRIGPHKKRRVMTEEHRKQADKITAEFQKRKKEE